MKYFWILIKTDFYIKVIKNNNLMYLFFSTLLPMFALYIANDQLNVSTIILPLAIACILHCNAIFDKKNSGFIEHIITSGCPSYIIAIAKFFVTYIILCITSIITLFIFFLLEDITFKIYLTIQKILLIYAIPLASISLITSTLTLKTKSSHWLGVLLSLPLILIFFMYLSSILIYHLELSTLEINIYTDLQIFILLSLISFIISICACSYLISKI